MDASELLRDRGGGGGGDAPLPRSPADQFVATLAELFHSSIVPSVRARRNEVPVPSGDDSFDRPPSPSSAGDAASEASEGAPDARAPPPPPPPLENVEAGEACACGVEAGRYSTAAEGRGRPSSPRGTLLENDTVRFGDANSSSFFRDSTRRNPPSLVAPPSPDADANDDADTDADIDGLKVTPAFFAGARLDEKRVAPPALLPRGEFGRTTGSPPRSDDEKRVCASAEVGTRPSSSTAGVTVTLARGPSVGEPVTFVRGGGGGGPLVRRPGDGAGDDGVVDPSSSGPCPTGAPPGEAGVPVATSAATLVTPPNLNVVGTPGEADADEDEDVDVVEDADEDEDTGFECALRDA